MASIQTQSIRAALRAAGAVLELRRGVIDATVMPTPGSAGYDVGESLVAELVLGLRRAGPARVVDYHVTTVDLAATYTATIDGTSVAYAAGGSSPADIADVVTEWADAVNADATLSAIVTATTVDRDGDGVADTMRCTGLSPDSYAATGSISGSGAGELIVDPDECRIRVYGDFSGAKGLTADRVGGDDALEQMRSWCLLRAQDGSAADVTITDGQGYPAPMSVAGADSIRAYVTDVAGHSADSSGTSMSLTTLNPTVAVYMGAV